MNINLRTEPIMCITITNASGKSMKIYDGIEEIVGINLILSQWS